MNTLQRKDCVCVSVLSAIIALWLHADLKFLLTGSTWEGRSKFPFAKYEV